jgi:hypothetical protein
MKAFLGMTSIITAGTVPHLHMDNVIIYSVIYISAFTNDIRYIYITFVYSVVPEDR